MLHIGRVQHGKYVKSYAWSLVGLFSMRLESGSRVVWLSGRNCLDDVFLWLFDPLLPMMVAVCVCFWGLCKLLFVWIYICTGGFYETLKF